MSSSCSDVTRRDPCAQLKLRTLIIYRADRLSQRPIIDSDSIVAAINLTAATPARYQLQGCAPRALKRGHEFTYFTKSKLSKPIHAAPALIGGSFN